LTTGDSLISTSLDHVSSFNSLESPTTGKSNSKLNGTSWPKTLTTGQLAHARTLK